MIQHLCHFKKLTNLVIDSQSSLIAEIFVFRCIIYAKKRPYFSHFIMSSFSELISSHAEGYLSLPLMVSNFRCTISLLMNSANTRVSPPVFLTMDTLRRTQRASMELQNGGVIQIMESL